MLPGHASFDKNGLRRTITNKVITMEMLGRIRRMYLRDKVSLHEITKRTGLSRNTVRRCRALWEEIRHPEYKQFSVAEMLVEQERGELMPMPTAFDGYVERSAKVSSTCLVAVARNRYSVPCELAGQRVSTRLYPNRVEIATDEAIVASHDRLANRGHICYDWQHYIALVQRKPGALRNGAPFADMPAPLQRLRQGLMRHDGGDKIMAQVLNCVSSHSLEAVLVAVALVIESGVLSTEHVLNVLSS